MNAPRFAHVLPRIVLPGRHVQTDSPLTGATPNRRDEPSYVMWTPGDLPPDVAPAPFRDPWSGNPDTDRAWRS